MKKILLILLMALIWAHPVYARISVVTTLPWIGSLAEELGKDRVEVRTLVKPQQDPHQIEARPSMILAARNADLLIYNGLDLEAGYLPVLIESSRNPRIAPGKAGNLDCSQFVNVMEKLASADRSLGDVHPHGNPHYHLSVRNILAAAGGMTDRMIRLDPDHAAFYRSNLATFWARVQEGQKRWAFVKLNGMRFVAYHRFFEYLAAERGFEIVAYVEEKPGIPPSVGYISRLVESMKKSPPDAIITTSYQNARDVAALSNRTGIKSLVVPHDVGADPEGQDWVSLMDRIMDTLK
ncbi:MAG: zinc/manganese transport system substrate-binding protein [Syntrophaceae bacterium]|nr:MAG: zinc/manganese transport system substrate-binding protein [Syntrophaceae bacterium]